MLASGIADKLSKSAESFETAYMEFEQVKEISFMESSVASKGIIVCDKQGRVRWEVESPFKSILLRKGDKIFRFEFTLGKWIKLSDANTEAFAKIIEQIRTLVLGNFSDANKDYEVFEKSQKLILVPKDERAKKFIKSIEITPSEDFTHPKKMVITDALSDTTTITFVRFIPNVQNIETAFDEENYEKFSKIPH